MTLITHIINLFKSPTIINTLTHTIHSPQPILPPPIPSQSTQQSQPNRRTNPNRRTTRLYNISNTNTNQARNIQSK